MIKRLPPKPMPSNRRIASRAAVAIEADLRKPGRTSFTIYVRDLSQTGCRAETLSKIQVGERVWLTLPGFGAMEGTVRWATTREFGCEWSGAIHSSVFDHIRAQYPDIVS